MAENETLKKLEEKFRGDPFCYLLGISLEEWRPGFARVSMEVTDSMVNFHGVTHGGAVFSLVDAAFAAASNSHGRTSLALNVNITYLAPTYPGARLVCTAIEERCGRRTALYRMAVEDQHGQLVALAQGVVYRRSEFLIPEMEEEI